MTRLLRAPYRLFFCAGMVQLLAVGAWWAATLAGLPTGIERRAHALLMLYGFLPLFIFGFLLTAGPRWLGVEAPAPRRYLPSSLLALAGALALLPALWMGSTATIAAIVVYAAGWLGLAVLFARLIAASRAADRSHARVAAGALALGLAGLIAWPRAASLAIALGLWGFLVPLFSAVCHRMIPFFTAHAVPSLAPWRPAWTLAALVGGSLAHGLLEISGLRGFAWLVDTPLALLAAFLSWRWGVAHSARDPLLLMVHAGFAWLAPAYALLPLGTFHAVTMGFLASVTMAMVSRVSSGHSGGTLAPGRATLLAFALLQGAAAARVAADLWRDAHAPLILAAVALWLAGFAPWAVRYLPHYWRPRPGKD